MKIPKILIPGVLALALASCASNATATPIPTIVVDGGNDTVKPASAVSSGGDVVASAVVFPAQDANLAFVAGGNVAKVNVKVGDRITAGHVLVELENTILQLEVDRAQRALRELTSSASLAAAEQAVASAQDAYDDAQKKVDNLKYRNSDKVTVDYLQDQVTLAQDALDRARDRYTSTKGLSDLDPARAKAGTELYNAQRAYNNALASFNWYTGLPSENDIATVNADFDAATAALQEAQWYLSELKGESIPADATGAKLAQLQQAKADITAAQNRLEQSRLIAPISGVIAQVNVIAGEYATPGKILIVISDVDNLQVKTTDLSERDIIKVKIGDSANIMVDALGQEFSGKVVNISPLANTLGGDVVYEVTLDFDEQPADVRSGMTADVAIGE